MSLHIQFRLDDPTTNELRKFIEENPESELTLQEAVRVLVRTALHQPHQRALALELVMFTSSMHLRVLDFVANQLKELGIDYVNPVAPCTHNTPDVAEEPAD